MKTCLDSLKGIDYSNYRVIVADDCSTDNSEELIRKDYPSVEIVKTASRSGFSVNNNNALHYARDRYNPEYFLLLNNDIILVREDCFSRIVDCASEDAGIGIVGVKLLYPEGKIQHAGITAGATVFNRGRAQQDRGQYDFIAEAEGVTGAFFLITAKALNTVGLFDEKLYMGMEDVDYCLRARKAGFKVVYNGLVSAVHLEGASSTHSQRQDFADERFIMNQTGNVYFAFKHLKNPFLIMSVIIYNLAGSILTIEDKNRSRRIGNIRFKDRIAWRFTETLKAIVMGYKVFRSSLGK